MRRYWRIYRTFFVSSFARELEFRANFFAKVVQNIVWIGFFVLILLVIYQNTNSVAGWGRGDAFVLGATVFIVNAISSALFFSVTEIPQQVRMGSLDFVITKPVDSQFWVSMRRFNLDQVGALLAGIAMVIIGLRMGGHAPSISNWFGYLACLIASCGLFYAFNLAMMTTGIWLVRVDNLFVLGDSLSQVARYPLDIYPSGVRTLLTYFLPLGLIATIPTRQLIGSVSPPMVALSLAWSAAALLFARWFWRHAMRSYSSASS